jgi:hypothetical protein
LNDQWGEGIRPNEEEGTAGKCEGKGSLVIHNSIAGYQMKVDDHGEVGKEHVDKGVVALFISLTPHAHAVISRVKPQD